MPDLLKTNPCLSTKHERVKFTSLIISPETAATEWFPIMKLLSVQLYRLESIMRFDRALRITRPLPSAKTRCPYCLDALVTTSVFRADLRLEFGGKTIAGLFAAS